MMPREDDLIARTPWPRGMQLGSLLLLHVVVGLSTAAAWLVLHDAPLSPLRIGLGAIATLLLPGYALSRVLIAVGRVQLAERLLLSLSLSLLLCMATMFFLNWLPTGISAYGWARALWLGTAVCCVLASVRSLLPIADAPLLLPTTVAPPVLRPRWYLPVQLLCAFLTIGLLLGTIVLGIRSAQQQPYPGFTQLWILPAPTDPTRFEIGIGNFEGTDVRYRLEVDYNDRAHAHWSQIVVRDTETVTTPLRLREPLARNEQLTVVLYRQDAPTQAYRQVRIWRNALQESDM
ncbi:MAG: DUF1616 domain-containing protein [Chloroflexaceae bacterium]|nr:DUF1616 domain-containing protein [Chloroflexaceae bacterium]